MHKKSGFTLLEMVVVITIMGIIFSFTRNFFNSDAQEKIVFGETCLNYVFGEVEKLKSDIDYGRSSGLLLDTNLSANYYIFNIDGYKSSTGGLAYATVFGISTTGASGFDRTDYEDAQMTQSTTPPQCKNKRFALIADSTSTPYILIPTKEVDPDMNRYLGNDRTGYVNTRIGGQITGEINFHVCSYDTIVGNIATNPRNCLQIGKIHIDKRAKQFYYWKCGKLNRQSGICGSRPTTN